MSQPDSHACPCCGQPLPASDPLPSTHPAPSTSSEPELDRRGVPLPPRSPVGGIITPI